MAFEHCRFNMRSHPARAAHLLTALLLLSLLNGMLGAGLPQTEGLSSDSPVQSASGRASSAEVFLSAGGSANGDVFPTAIDATDTGYAVVGDYNRTLTFGTHTLAATSPFSNGNEFFLASMNNAGDWDYLVGADHSMGSVSFVSDVASSAGMPVVAGYMYGPVSFGQTSLSTQVLDGFIAKAGPGGNWMWATAFQTVANSSTDISLPQAVAVDSLGDVVVAGYFSGETDFGGTTFNVSNEELFIAKLDGNNGALKWAITGGGIGAQRVTDLVIDSSGNIMISAITQNNVLFGTKNYATVGTQDSLVVKISSSGTFSSVTGYGIAGQVVTASAMALDANNNLYVGGTFEGTMTKNGWSITANKGGTDIFFLKEGTTSNNQWATVGGSNANDNLGAMGVTSSYSLIFTSYIQGTFSGGTKSVTPSANLDGLVGGLSSTGGWSWLDVTGSSAYEASLDLAVNASDIVATTGAFANNGPATITKDTTTVTSTGGWDTYVWAIDPSMKADSDNDGVPDVTDNCPTVSNPLQGNTDGDPQGDACDSDDDNDGITDNAPDNCARGGQANWQSTQDFNDPANSTDWDRDGCKDDAEDNDIDNDGVQNADDTCPRSEYQPPRPTWVSDSITDVDGDGCRDSDEDSDDDGDGFADVSDDCPTVVGTSTLGEEGCLDNDGDGWSNNFDDCPDQAGNSTLGGKNACPDTDGDGWANSDDDFIDDPTQWTDTDMDGYGDNPSGTTPDDCISVSGTSTADRLGCLDTDGDGHSDPDSMWDSESGADAFVDDPTQWSDYDGDGYGDNYANTTWDDRNPSWPGTYNAQVTEQDACPTQEGTSWQNGMIGCPDQDGDGWYNLQDAFPNDATQWEDRDGDGYGDNASGVDADACPDVAGTSSADRLGCTDTDGDGYSDPEMGWTPFENNADAFVDDPTQWFDQDNDQFGDNPAGTTPDECPTEFGKSTIDRQGCIDSDGDGYSDADAGWTVEQGADACQLVSGTSTADRIGCVDTDNDNYSDPTPNWLAADGADAYPEDPTRWILEAAEEQSLLASPVVLIGGGVGVLVVLGILGFVLRGRREEPETKWSEAYGGGALPNYAAQPAQQVAAPNFNAQPAQQVAAPNFNAQPAVAQPAYVPPVAQPDPARDYYNGLLAQGYPPEDAMRYTRQYYAEFHG
jgi:hypothetical protein